MADTTELRVTGQRLIYFAWVIEIVVALVSFAISISFIVRGQQQLSTVSEIGAMRIDIFIGGLAFFVVGIAELSKIPIATALYNAAKQRFKVIFLIALVAVNVLTIETIVQALRTSFNSNSLAVDVVRQKLSSVEDKLQSIGEFKNILDAEDKKISNQILEYNNLIKDEQDNIENYRENARKDINALIDSENKATPEIKILQEQINAQKIEKKNLNNKINNIFSSPEIVEIKSEINKENENIKKFENEDKRLNDLLANSKFGERTKRTTLRNQIKTNTTLLANSRENLKKLNSSINRQAETISQKITIRIKDLEKKLSENESKLVEKLAIKNNSSEPQIKEIETLREKNISSSNNSIKNYLGEISILNKLLSRNNNNENSNETISPEQRLELIEERDLVIKEFRDIAGKNQIYSLALALKLIPNPFSFLSGGDDTDKNINIEDLTQEDIERAFWIWGGLLAFIISIIGTLIAIAGLHLKDKEAHEEKNIRIASKTTFTYRLRRFFVSLIRYFSTSVRVMLKPRTVEKIVEKEVVVEKIIEKPVVQEKIVVQKVEVVKEAERKVYVHVPLPTDDPILLKKGPFVYDGEKKPRKK